MQRARTLAILLSVALFAGCAFTPQTVVIEPMVEVTPSDIGGGHAVSVYVVDERDSTEIGRRGTGAMKGAAITTEQDVASVFRRSIVENLNKMGYAASESLAGDPVAGATLLRVDIRAISYETSMGFWTGGVHARGSMKATGTRGSTVYDKLYRVDDEKRVVVVPGADSNAQMVNTTVSALLQEMFNDVELMRYLAAD
jgi:uncharacterized lipoprotein